MNPSLLAQSQFILYVYAYGWPIAFISCAVIHGPYKLTWGLGGTVVHTHRPRSTVQLVTRAVLVDGCRTRSPDPEMAEAGAGRREWWGTPLR